MRIHGELDQDLVTGLHRIVAALKDRLETADGKNMCGVFCGELSSHYPALQRVRGQYWCPNTRKFHPHWWLLSEENVIIDPTSDQFPSHGSGRYAAEYTAQPLLSYQPFIER